MTVAVLGGTGKEGSALAIRWALSGRDVIIGSRTAEKAETKVAELNAEYGTSMRGMANEEASANAEIIVLSVPYGAHKPTLEGVRGNLSGKVLIDVTVPLAPPKVSTVHLPDGSSACMEAQEFLGDDVRVVAAFQNVSYAKLKQVDKPVDCDVLVCGDDADAKDAAIALVEAAGMRGMDAGPLANAVAAEAMTPVLIYIGKRYKAMGAGIRITGVES